MIVPAEGPLKCKMAIVGEAPGREEEEQGRPFVGISGSLLNTKLHLCGISRQECYITNLVKTRPPGNDFGIYWKGTQPTPELLEWKRKLLEELDGLDTNIIVALGANALWALASQTKIGKWRGSVLTCNLPSERKIKLIGTYHPAAVLREWTLGAVLQFDLKKALRESEFPELIETQRELLIGPTYEDVVAYISDLHNYPAIAFDIETNPSNITCLSLAASPHKSMSIPTTQYYWGSTKMLKYVLENIDWLLNNPKIIKVAQNISFDVQYIMRFFGILPSKPWYDTMVAQHSCYSELPKSLDFLCSIYTNQIYYKDDLRIWRDTGESNDELLWRYNALDSAVTIECMHELNKEMKTLHVEHTFDYIMELAEPLIYMMMRGVKFDKEKSNLHKGDYDKKIAELEGRFKAKFGDINPQSPKQMANLAYNTLGLAPITKGGKVTCDKKAIDKLAIKSPDIKLAADIRSERTIASNYLDIPLDPIDSRLRCSFSIGFDDGTGKGKSPETRRLSSSQSVFGSGRNLQNIPKRIRDIIIPDQGMIFTEADLAGAESRVVAYLSDDPIGIRIFEEGKNIHTHTACMVFNVEPNQVKEQREELDAKGQETETWYFKAKKLRHSVEKRGSFITVSEQLKIQAAEAKRLIQKFYDLNPNLLRWFRKIEEQLKKNRTIITPFGDKRIFFGRFGDKMVGDAAAHITQETIGRVINTGIINIYNTLCKSFLGIEVLLQVHDSVLLQHDPCHKEMIYKEVPKCLDIEIPYQKGHFKIPIDMKSGENWRDLK